MKFVGVQMLFVSLLFVAVFQVNKAWLFGGGAGVGGGNGVSKSYLYTMCMKKRDPVL